MRMRLKIMLIVAAIAVVCLVGWRSSAQNTSKTNWEYKVITAYGTNDTPPPNISQFNQLGDEGWELVTALSEQSVRGDRRQIKIDYFFKRAKGN